ncbi:MAG: S49 family peptidase [Anaerolineales bacterium]|nr:S49 family peptidase [Anaerolineales bacterium]
MPSVLYGMVERVRAGTPIQAGPTPTASRRGTVAVLPIYGTITQKGGGGFMDFLMGGGTSTEKFGAMFSQVMADESVKAVVLDIDSPGGSVFGVPELADMIFKARGGKPIIAVSNSLAASAAYWLASQADQIVVSPSSEVGSIGVYALHEDISEMVKGMGVAVTLVSAGKHKTEANEVEPLSEEARDAIQARVDDYYGMFVKAVARGRGVTESAVRGGFGEGRVVGAVEAVKLNMADRVATLGQTLQRFAGSGGATMLAEEPVEILVEAEPVVVAEEAPPESKGVSPDIRRRRLELAR